MMKKKLIAIILCASMLALCACGTGGAKEASSVNASSKEQTSEDTTAGMTEGRLKQKEIDDLYNELTSATPTPAPKEPKITFGSENFRILGLSIDDLAEMSNEDVKEAFKEATGADDDAISMGYGELENTDPEKYSSITFDYSENGSETEIQVRDHALDKNPHSSYAAIYLHGYDSSRSFDALLWATEFDGKYISGLDLTNEMTKDDIYKMLDFETLKEIAGDDYYEDEYQIQMSLKDIKTADGKTFKSLYFIQMSDQTCLDIYTEDYNYSYSYSYKDDKLERFGVSIRPKK